jgi:cytochrome P450
LRNFGYGKAALEDIIEEEIDNLIEHIDQNYLNQPVEVSRFFNIAVLSSLWRIISGEHLKVGDPKLEHLVETVSNMAKEFGRPELVVSMNYPYLFSILHYFGVLKFLSYTNTLFDFVMDTISSHKTKHIDGEHPLTFTEAMLHKIHQTHEKDDPFHGDVGELNLLNVLLDLFIAGSDTTSITLNWAMLYMILNQDIQKNVRKELNESIGRQRKAKMAEKYLTPYTEAVIHEIQRRGNILPLSVFHSIQDNDTQTSFQVGQRKLPPKTVLIPLIGEVMHDPLYFPNPTRFDPNRYLSEEENGQITFKPHPRVIPFGIGKRRCLGEVLARMTLYKFFTALVQKYEIVSGQDEPITDEAKTGFTRSPIDYRIIFRPIL